MFSRNSTRKPSKRENKSETGAVKRKKSEILGGSEKGGPEEWSGGEGPGEDGPMDGRSGGKGGPKKTTQTQGKRKMRREKKREEKHRAIKEVLHKREGQDCTSDKVNGPNSVWA